MHSSLFPLLLSVAVSGCAAAAHPREDVTVRSIGGPTALIEIGGARFLTDPTFSAPGAYEVAPGRSLTKLEGPALAAEAIGEVDAVLLSHDQHVDNLDPAGRAFVARARLTYSTPAAAARLAGHVIGLLPWQVTTFTAPGGRRFRITGVPAQHGPDDTEHITGAVVGFLIASDGLPTVYVSGDNASVEVVRSIAARAHVDLAVLFVGAAKSPRLLGDALLTLDGARASEVAQLLPGAAIVPVHFRGWGHFTQGADALRAAFGSAGLAARLHLLAPGESVSLASKQR